MVLIAILAAAIGWYISKEYHELIATRRRQQEIVIAIFISILSILGLQKAMKTYQKWMEPAYANITVYNPKSKSAAPLLPSAASVINGLCTPSPGNGRGNHM